MAVLIDEPIWWFKGRRWSHLVSDVSYDELHDFAERAGIPRRGFQGDHYDVPEEFFDDLVGAGAMLMSSRELLRRLRGAGLRLTPTERRQRRYSTEEARVTIDPVRPADREGRRRRPGRR